jgi:hypothetical protein
MVLYSALVISCRRHAIFRDPQSQTSGGDDGHGAVNVAMFPSGHLWFGEMSVGQSTDCSVYKLMPSVENTGALTQPLDFPTLWAFHVESGCAVARIRTQNIPPPGFGYIQPNYCYTLRMSIDAEIYDIAATIWNLSLPPLVPDGADTDLVSCYYCKYTTRHSGHFGRHMRAHIRKPEIDMADKTRPHNQPR